MSAIRTRFTLWILCFLFFCSGALIAKTEYFNLTVEISGVNEPEKTIVLSNLSIQAALTEKKINQERIENLHAQASQEIAKSLEALGYYHHQIEDKLSKQGNHYHAQYAIILNRPTRIASVQVEIKGEGLLHPKLQSLAADPPLISGNILKQSEYESYKHHLLSQAIQAGFLQASFDKHEIQIDQNRYSANIILILNTGKSYRIGEVTFKNPPYPESYLKRYILYKPGSLYTTDRLAALQKNLSDTELFRYVRVEPQYDESTDDCIPLCIHLRPLPKNRYFGSMGYGTDTGMRGLVGWERRRVRYPGHQISTTIKASQRFNEFNFRYTIPGLHPATDRLVMGAKLAKEKERDKKYSLRGDISLAQIKKIDEVEYLVACNYLSETYQKLQATPKQHAHFLMPSLGAVWTHITEKEPRMLGFRLGFTLRGAAKPVFSTVSFIEADCRLKWIAPLGESARLIFRTQFSALLTRSFNQIPLSMRYLTGGDQTVRGYGYRTLGPRQIDPLGNLVNVGGPYLFIGSLEVEKTIYKDFAVAAFLDAGNAMNSLKGKIPRGAGVGLRYHTPIGDLRLDLAYPVSQKPHRPRIHFTFGTDL